MDKIRIYRELQAPEFIEPRDIGEVEEATGNVYQSLAVISQRANQIGIQLKEELHGKLEEFAVTGDTLEEVMENREQIEISKYYEKLPHPTILATEEVLTGKVYFRHRDEDAEEA